MRVRLPGMRVGVAGLLIALLAIVALPSEAMLAEQSGSVVDQVTSCLQPNGLARDSEPRATAGTTCHDDVPSRPPVALLAVVASLLVGLSTGSGSRTRGGDERGLRLPDAAFRSGAPWRAPPRPV